MYLQEMLVPNNTHAYMASRQENRQASKQPSDNPSEARQARAKLMYNTKCYHTRHGYRLPLTAQPCLRDNYARMELAKKC